MAIRIIKATVKEANDIARVGRQSFYDAFHSLFIRKAELETYLEKTYDEKKLEQSIDNPNNLFLVAYDNEKPVGFVKLKKQAIQPQLGAARQTELQKIYVLTEYHGSGVAQTLLNIVVEAANDWQPEYVWLNVHVSNVKAKRFYEKNGFTKVGKHYYTIGTQKFEFDLMALPVTETILNQ